MRSSDKPINDSLPKFIIIVVIGVQMSGNYLKVKDVWNSKDQPKKLLHW